MSTKPHLPEPVQPTIADFIALINEQLPGWINGFYIVGSIALGEFNAQFSDIDFVATLTGSPTAKEIDELYAIHGAIEKKHPRWKLSGSYIQPGALGKLDGELEPHLYYHDGVLHPNHRLGLNPVTWWELKNHGMAVVGPEPQQLPFTVDWDRLILWMRENMNSYWLRWTDRPGRILMMYTNWGIQWAVLGVLRQFYTFRENSITAKVKAARYALGCLPARWHRLIQEAIDIRLGKKPSAYRFRITRTIEAVDFLKYILQLCNTSDKARRE